MGILGIYIGKTFEESKGRPLYFVRDTMNLGMATSTVNLEVDTSR
jgi:hypothetical protein